MQRLLVVLFGVLVFQGSVWAAKCDEMTAKVLSPGANSVLIKDLPFVLQWQDDDLCLGKQVTIDLVDATGTGSRIAYRKNKKDYKFKHPNSGFLNIDRLIAPVSDHQYRFKISPAKKAQGQESIESEPIVVRLSNSFQKKGGALGSRSYASIPYQIGDLLTRFAALEERLAELTGVGGEQELTHTQVEFAKAIHSHPGTGGDQWNELKEELAVMKQNILSNSDLVRQTRQEGQPGQAIVQGSPSEQTPLHQLEALRAARYKREAQEANRARAKFKETVWDTDESGRLPPGTAWEAIPPRERTAQYDACWYSSGVEDTDKSAGIWVVAPPGNILCGAWGNEATCREEMRLWATLQCCASVSGSCEQPSIGPRCKNILPREEGEVKQKQRDDWTDQQMMMVDCFGDGDIHGPAGSFRPPNIHGNTCGIQFDIFLEPPKC